MKKLLFKTMLLLCALVAGNASAWATTYKLTQVTSVSTGNKYVFIRNSRALSNSISSNALQSTNSYSTKGLSGTESYIWTLESATGGFYLYNYSLDKYLNNPSSTNVSLGTKSSIWTIAFTDGIALISNNNNSDRFLGDTGGTGESSKNTYKAYASSNLSSYGHDFTVYILEEEVFHTLTYSATNGTISGVAAGNTAVASGASVAEGATVTLTATPSAGYAFSSWSVDGTGATLTSTSTNPTTFTMGTANATVTANFEVNANPTIGLSSTSVAKTADAANGTINITYDNITSPTAEVLFYESDGTTPATYAWLNASINSTDNTKLDYAISENTGAARTAYMKVHETTANVYSQLITITQEALVVNPPTFSPSAGAITIGTNITLTQASADQIRYTTDGTTPTKTTGTVYSTPISITTATTIKAIAIKNGVASNVAEAAYTINVATPTYTIAGGKYLQGTGITLTSSDNTIYYTMKTDGTDPSAPTSNSTPYTEPITLSSGTNKIKAIAYDTYGNKSSVVSRTYYGIAPTSLPFNWAGGTTEDFLALTGIVGNSLGDYGESHTPYLIQFNDTGDYIEIFTNGQPGKVSIAVKMIGGENTSKIKVQESNNGIEFADVEELTISGSQGSKHTLETTQPFATTTRVVKLLFTKGSNVGVGPISIVLPEPAVPVIDDVAHTVTLTTTANMDGWRTFAPSKADQNYTADADVYYVSESGATTVTLVKIAAGVPANTPVILHKTTGTTITLTETATDIDAPAGNLLAVSATNQNLGTVYRLGYKSANGVGFYTYTSSSAPAGIVYVSSSNTARDYLGFAFENEATAISATLNDKGEMTNDSYFNLAGQRVAQPTNGLYIVNGRKVIVK